MKHDTVEAILRMDPSFDSRAVHAKFVREKGKWINISLNLYATLKEYRKRQMEDGLTNFLTPAQNS